jgi:pilus assembly protein CpaD
MNSLPRLISAIAGLLITTACTTPELPIEQARIDNIGVVDAIDGTFTVAMDGQGRISPAERSAALKTLSDFGAVRTVRARVESGTTAQARAALVELFADAGVPPGHLSFGGDAATAPGQVRIALQRFEVTPPTCAGWPDIQKNYVENGPVLPMGCVTNRNLQLMVEDPRDLIVGRSLGDADTEREVAAVNRYRADKVKPFLSNTATGGSGASLSRQ